MILRKTIGQSVLRAPSPDDGGEGGGGGSSLTKDDVAELISGALKDQDAKMNKAITGHLSRQSFKDGLVASIKDAIGSTGTAEPAGTEPNDEGKKGDAAQAELATMRAKMTALENDHKAQQAKLKDEREQLNRREEKGALAKSLTAAGIPSGRVAGATALLFGEYEKVARNDEGEIKFRVKRDWGDELVSIDDGVKEWLDTDEGKSFAPAAPGTGTGGQQGAFQAPPGVSEEKAKAAGVLNEFFMQR